MIERIPDFIIKNRFLVIIFIVILIAVGIYSLIQMPVDVYPDLNAPVVTVVTENHGMAPEEIEVLITFPLETTFNSLPYVKRVRSSSLLGISLIHIEFEYGVDIYFARQLVSEKLQLAGSRLPEGTETPFMGPVSSMFADAVEFTIAGSDDLYFIRDFAEWTIKPRLQTVPGVSNVINFGGYLKQFHVLIDPEQLFSYRVTVKEVVDAIAANNRNASGGYLLEKSEEKIIRGIGRINDIEDIGDIVVKEREGVPVYIKNIAEIKIGAFVRRGTAGENGKEVVAITVQNQYNANVVSTIRQAQAEIEKMKNLLPENVRMEVFYTQLDMIMRSIQNVRTAIIIGALLVIAVLYIFLGSFRSTIIVALTIPLSVIIAFIFMRMFNLTINIMTMGGLAIGIGMMVDSAIIMTENIYRHLQEGRERILEAAGIAAKEVIKPILFATLIVLAVFAPVFTLHGLEGKMFIPMAFAVFTALLGSLIISLSLTVVLSTFFLKNINITKKENFLLVYMKRIYNPLLNYSLSHGKVMVLIVVCMFLLSLILLLNMGTEFMPEIDESGLIMDVVLPPETSLEESSRIASLVSREVLKVPEVTRVVRRTGRAESAEHAEPVNLTEANVVLIPKEKRERSIEEIKQEIRNHVGNIPGVLVSLIAPLQHRVNHMVTGTRADIAVKLFGENLGTLREYAERIESLISEVEGATDIQVEQTIGVPQIRIEPDRNKIARYGLNVIDISEIIEIALNGKVATELIETHKKYDIFVRFQEKYRNSVKALENILIDTPGGMKIPLSELAEIRVERGPSLIRRENTLRRIMVQCNVSGRDMGSVVNDIKDKINEIDLPAGYFVNFGGTYENQMRAMKQLFVVVIFTILIVFVLLFVTFNSFRNALLIIINVPLAVVGGITILFITGIYLSVPALVGFIALIGIAVQDGIVLVSHINRYREFGIPLREALVKAGNTKLRPVLLTTFTTMLGVIPLVLMNRTGSELQRPLGLVLMAGLAFSTVLTLIVLPTLYALFEKKEI